MLIKQEKGISGIDLIVSVFMITIFVALISTVIANINIKTQSAQRKTQAMSYAVQEIEQVKSEGYLETYDELGITGESVIQEMDIYVAGKFTGYHKKVTIKDYIFIKNDNTKEKNLLKEITVQISYKLANEQQEVQLSTYITKE